jgi:hypothetical protein
MSRRQRNNREERLHHRARALVNATGDHGLGFPWGNQWLGNHGRGYAWLAEHGLEFICDICLLKGINPQRGQDKRRDTLTGARLNAAIIKLGEPAPPDGLTFASQSWVVDDDPAIAAERRLEAYECDYISARLGLNVTTERARVEDLNLRHAAWLESITGKTIEVADDKRQHPAGFNQEDAIAMAAEDVGFNVFERRNRHNDLLEPAEKLNKRGRHYRANKAAPGRRLTGEALIAAIAELRPAKKGWPYTKPYPRGDEVGLFEKCRRAGRKQPQDYTCFEDHDTQMYHDWDKIGTRDGAGSADRHRFKPLINIPEGWSRNSYAQDVMLYRSKKTGWEWGNLLFDQIFYSDRSLNERGLLLRTPVIEKTWPLHESYSPECPVVFKL